MQPFTDYQTKLAFQASLIPIIVDITANHQGHFEFKLCPNDNIFLDPSQDCFDAHVLATGDNDYKYPINDYETGMRLLYVRYRELPSLVSGIV